MNNIGARRIATAQGAMLADPDLDEQCFEPRFWEARGELDAVSAGRGAAWFAGPTRSWALRHYRRGGMLARLWNDRYPWCGESRVRSFAEYRLLAAMHALGLPVPRPIAARYRRSGLWYRCDILTQRIAGARPLSSLLAEAPFGGAAWQSIGAAVARLHRAGVDHADLNAHNILMDGEGLVSVIDFDRGRMRPPGRWASRNLRRLHRSLTKIAAGMPAGRFTPAAWARLLQGYES